MVIRITRSVNFARPYARRAVCHTFGTIPCDWSARPSPYFLLYVRRMFYHNSILLSRPGADLGDVLCASCVVAPFSDPPPRGLVRPSVTHWAPYSLYVVTPLDLSVRPDYHDGLAPGLLTFPTTPMATVSMGNVFEACALFVSLSRSWQNLIICQRCRYALAPSCSRVTSYLLRKHQVQLPVRKGLTTLLRQQRTRFQEPAYTPPRPDGSAADPSTPPAPRRLRMPPVRLSYS